MTNNGAFAKVSVTIPPSSKIPLPALPNKRFWLF